MPSTKELIQQLNGDQDAAFKACKALHDQAARATAPGKEADRNAMAAELAAEFAATKKDDKGKNKTGEWSNTVKARNAIARLLGCVAGPAQVSVLAEAMKSLDVRESARMALAEIPGAEATAALIAALDDSGPAFLAGVVGALGRRNSPDAATTLKKVVSEKYGPEVRLEAALALANYPDPSADGVIDKMASRSESQMRRLADVARIRLAMSLMEAGKKSEARSIYRAIASADGESPQKKAADIGLKQTA